MAPGRDARGCSILTDYSWFPVLADLSRLRYHLQLWQRSLTHFYFQ